MARTREFDTDAAITAAMDLFWSRGYEGTSIQDIVEVTGVQRGSLYAAFGSKENLYLVALDRYREFLSQRITDRLRAGQPIHDVLRSALLSLVDLAVDARGTRCCLIIGATAERLPVDPQVAARVRNTMDVMEEALHEGLAAAQQQGQIAAGKDPRALARFFVMTIQGLRVVGTVRPDRDELTSTVDAALTVLG
ncbi:TetR/AcrR family transcriptional regulator [Actinoplanes sp. TBRC 11911]|uniref:TetR/AcrR family transcriptional regulator n=1 Tax=Actinoplanes sp. TBRC 11911 TaxID=2729386 RepID=UPI00145E7B33|nr:TetR/AcrR family transcriptional regulator [Actinoplanes sp. TBRC 11911]NMO53761.1 TetR/AcrR family transcriptional regulator [Actinoplanes sp. TBRC 11911]